jgi:hypothetical protein
VPTPVQSLGLLTWRSASCGCWARRTGRQRPPRRKICRCQILLLYRDSVSWRRASSQRLSGGMELESPAGKGTRRLRSQLRGTCWQRKPRSLQGDGKITARVVVPFRVPWDGPTTRSHDGRVIWPCCYLSVSPKRCLRLADPSQTAPYSSLPWPESRIQVSSRIWWVLGIDGFGWAPKVAPVLRRGPLEE